MRRQQSWRVAAIIAFAGAAAAGCGSEDDSTAASSRSAITTVKATTEATTTEATTSEATTTEATTAEATTGSSSAAGPITLFSDDFVDDRNRWGIHDDPEFGSSSFEAGDYVWNFRGSAAHWLPDVLGERFDTGDLLMTDVVVRAELTISAGGGVAGVFCRENVDTDADWQWYEFVVRDRYAAIRRTDSEGNIESLADTKSLDLPLGEPITLEARCQDTAAGTADLSLAVNESPLLDTTVTDAVLGNGLAGLQAWTFPRHEQIDIAWHSFSIAPAI